MKVRDIISETPLPSGWDKSIFKPGRPYGEKIDYALLRAKKIKSGTSRVVMTIKHDGRETALKVATQSAGLHQNKNEAKILKDPEFADILIPMIDYDVENELPEWIHVEKAKPMDGAKFKALVGMKPDEFTQLLIQSLQYGLARLPSYSKGKVSPFIVKVNHLVRKYDLTPGDLGSPQNWGIYDGRAVLIDVGLDEATYNHFY